jgi:hypothetical protein
MYVDKLGLALSGKPCADRDAIQTRLYQAYKNSKNGILQFKKNLAYHEENFNPSSASAILRERRELEGRFLTFTIFSTLNIKTDQSNNKLKRVTLLNKYRDRELQTAIPGNSPSKFKGFDILTGYWTNSTEFEHTSSLRNNLDLLNFLSNVTPKGLYYQAFEECKRDLADIKLRYGSRWISGEDANQGTLNAKNKGRLLTDLVDSPEDSEAIWAQNSRKKKIRLKKYKVAHKNDPVVRNPKNKKPIGFRPLAIYDNPVLSTKLLKLRDNINDFLKAPTFNQLTSREKIEIKTLEKKERKKKRSIIRKRTRLRFSR